MERPLYIAFVWHMHQPYYKDSLTGKISMPWVRLHGVKDYYNMAALLKGFPKVRQTFNLVPSLIDQLEDYVKEEPPDEKFLNISLRPAKDLDYEEKKFIILNFFMANWQNMVLPLPRFRELLLRRGRFISASLADRVMKSFTTQDYLDIQVLFNLSWFDPALRDKDPALKRLLAQGSRFTEEDKRLVIDKQLEVIREIIPLYKMLQENGQIEVSVSPYYHPILPLLCDTDIAKTGMPKATLPKERFSHPEDAKWHVENAVKRYEEVFARKPAGMWPSEGSVSDGIIPLLINAGIKWLATDEGILLRSAGKPRTAELLYRPYLLRRGGGSMDIIFRDRGLSDAVGFVYQNIPAQQAVDDFFSNLRRIKVALQGLGSDNFLVTVLLDGENAWEYYTNNGRDFLTALYRRLGEEERWVKTTTVSDFLNANPPREELQWLYPGSWINSNFSIWIGNEEKNTAWEYLSAARTDLLGFQQGHPKPADSEELKRAWMQIYIAEGSDWNWWYGPQNSSANDEEFDRLYRTHLANVYRLIGRPPYEGLKMPIITRAARPTRRARGLLKPVIDGLDTTYYEWLEAACFDVGTVGGTMHRAQSIIKNICCGFDLNTLFIKIVLKLPESLEANKENIKLAISKAPAPEARIEVPVFDDKKRLKGYLYKRSSDAGGWILTKEVEAIAYKKILELGIPFAELEIKKGQDFKLAFFIEEDGLTLESQPETGPITLRAPTVDYEAYNWTV